jgi:hypothetical protein
MKKFIYSILLLLFTLYYAKAQDTEPASPTLITSNFTWFKSTDTADTHLSVKSGSNWWNFAREPWVNKYFIRLSDSTTTYITPNYLKTHSSSIAHADSLFALAEKLSNKSSTPSASTTFFPSWLGVENYAYPLIGNPSNFITTINGIAAGGDLSGTYPNPTINTINGVTKGYYDFTSSGQTQLNTKQPMLISGTNIKTINGSSLLGGGNLTISGGGGSYTANQPLNITGSVISLDTTTAIAGVQTKGAAQNQFNTLSSQVNTATQQLTDNPGIPALSGYTTNIAVAYGTIRIYPNATKAFQLRRAKDNVTQDFYFDSDGNVNRDDINKFLDGYRGYLTIWYDQSPNGVNAIQTAPELQPYITVEGGVVKVRFEELYTGDAGHALTYTLASPINVNNTTVFSAYSSYIASGIDSDYPVANFSSRYLMSSANAKLDLYIDGANTTKPDALSLNGTSTSSLYSWSHNNYWAINSNSSTVKVSSNYSNVSLSPVSSYTETQFKIGNKYATNGNPFSGDIYTYIQYSTSQSDAILDTLASRLKIPYTLVTPIDNNISVVICGDSESNGRGAVDNKSYSKQMNSLQKTWLINFARSSNSYAFQNSKNHNSSIDACITPGKTNILFTWLGTNDLSGAVGPVVSLSTTYNNAISYAQARHTSGFNKVVMLTAMDRGSVGSFASFNNILKTDTTNFDAVLDVAADSSLMFYPGFNGSTTGQSSPDLVYFSSDRTHLTNEGYKKISSYTDNYLESITSNSLSVPYARRIKKLEDYISGLQNNTILNRNAIQHGSLGVDSNLYVNHIYSSEKPLTDLYIDANKTSSTANIGNLYFNNLGYSHITFGTSTIPVTGIGYTFTYTPAPTINQLAIALYNPHSTTSTIYFLNNGSNPINNAYIQEGAGSSATLLLYSLYKLTLESNQSPVALNTIGQDGFAVAPINIDGTYYPLTGTYGETAAPDAFLSLSPGLAGTKGAFMRTHLGVDQTIPDLGAFTYANQSGTNRLAFVPSGSTYKRFALTNDVTPTNGQIAIGNGIDYSVANILSSGNIDISNGAGSITIGNKSYSLLSNRTTITDANYSALSTDYLISYTSLTTSRTVMLIPLADKQMQEIKDESGTAGTNNIIISAPSGHAIDGLSSKTINTNYGDITLFYVASSGNYFTK